MGWAGLKNGDLLRLAEKHFDVFITVDRNLSFHQDLPKFGIAVLMHVPTNRFADLKPLVPDILAALPTVKGGHIMIIGT